MLKRSLVFTSPATLSLKNAQLVITLKELWFDVEKRYNTTFEARHR